MKPKLIVKATSIGLIALALLLAGINRGSSNAALIRPTHHSVMAGLDPAILRPAGQARG